jgi:Lrp/AsnC family transcriptional regulator for asnA, asnC and gidA
MKDAEKEIIKQIRHGKRASMSSIARILNEPISTISDRIKKVEEKYVVKRSSIIDFEKAGYYANSIFIIKVTPRNKDELFQFLKDENIVNSLFCTNSGYDFVVEAIFENQLKSKNWQAIVSERFEADITEITILRIEEKEKFMP